MSEGSDNRLTEMLETGWAVAGYSTCLSTLGIITHHVLLQQGSKLTTIMIAIKGADEEGRSLNALSPAPPLKKKGWFD
jgi:hypothetical protein